MNATLDRMASFNKIKLGDAITFQRGFDITKSEQTEGEIPIVSSSGISSFHNQWKANGPGVVIGRKGTLGTAHYLKGNFWPHDTTLWVKDFKGNNRRFIYFFLQTLHLENFDTGSSNPTLNRNHVHKIKIIFPKLNVQQKIAAILSAYDDLIENNQLRIALLEKMAEEIYREWFVRMRFPGHEKVKKVKGVPEGWEPATINQLVEFQSGYSFKSETYVPDGQYGIVTIKNVHDGMFFPNCTDFVQEIPSNMKKHCVLQEGDMLMSLTGNVGRVCQVYGENILLNQRVVKLKPKQPKSRSYVYWFFRQSGVQTLAELISTGAAQQNLSPIKFGNQRILVPNQSVLEMFEDKVSSLNTFVLRCHAARQKLAKTRDMLLPRLISGKLSVEHLDIRFPPGMEESAHAN